VRNPPKTPNPRVRSHLRVFNSPRNLAEKTSPRQDKRRQTKISSQSPPSKNTKGFPNSQRFRKIVLCPRPRWKSGQVPSRKNPIILKLWMYDYPRRSHRVDFPPPSYQRKYPNPQKAAEEPGGGEAAGKNRRELKVGKREDAPIQTRKPLVPFIVKGRKSLFQFWNIAPSTTGVPVGKKQHCFPIA